MNYISWLFPPNQQSLIRDYRLNEQHWNWIESKSIRSVSWLKWSLINPKMQNAERQRILHNGWRSHFRRALITIAVVHCSNFFSPFSSMDFEIQFNWTDKAQAPTNWEWLRTTSSQNVWGWWMDSYVLTRFFLFVLSVDDAWVGCSTCKFTCKRRDKERPSLKGLYVKLLGLKMLIIDN